MCEVPVAGWRRALVIIAVLLACAVSVLAILGTDSAQLPTWYVMPVLTAIPLLARLNATCRTWCLTIGVGQALMDAYLPLGLFGGTLWFLPSTLLLIAAGFGRTRST